MSVTIAPTEDVEACHALRIAVFVAEQGIALADEIDDLDGEATHLLAKDAHGFPVGTARLLERGETGKIGRVCVLRPHRGTGLGARLITTCVETFRNRPHITQVKLSAQTHAVGFYERLGFTAIGEEYPDAGIPHIDMVLSL